MTREELRDYVEEQRNLDVIPYHIYSALIDGIDTLEQEPCEDAISRQAVLEVLKDKWNMFSDANDAMQESIDTIEALSNVSPQPKTGHWIYDNTN